MKILDMQRICERASRRELWSITAYPNSRFAELRIDIWHGVFDSDDCQFMMTARRKMEKLLRVAVAVKECGRLLEDNSGNGAVARLIATIHDLEVSE